jgi:hypothetical protein
LKSDKIKENILSWLVEEGFEVQKGPVPPGAPFEWTLLVKVPAPLVVNITIQKPKNFDKVSFTMVVKLSPEHLQAFRSKPIRERASLIADILIDMLRVCPKCIVINQPPKLDETEALIATREILYDDLNKTSVVDTLRLLANIYQLVVLRIASALEPVRGGQSSFII